jgi:hypothetical protein
MTESEGFVLSARPFGLRSPQALEHSGPGRVGGPLRPYAPTPFFNRSQSSGVSMSSSGSRLAS